LTQFWGENCSEVSCEGRNAVFSGEEGKEKWEKENVFFQDEKLNTGIDIRPKSCGTKKKRRGIHGSGKVNGGWRAQNANKDFFLTECLRKQKN